MILNDLLGVSAVEDELDDWLLFDRAAAVAVSQLDERIVDAAGCGQYTLWGSYVRTYK